MRNSCPETLLNFYPLKCTSFGISSFNFISSWSEKLSLKSDQLEVGGSVYKKGSAILEIKVPTKAATDESQLFAYNLPHLCGGVAHCINIIVAEF